MATACPVPEFLFLLCEGKHLQNHWSLVWLGFGRWEFCFCFPGFPCSWRSFPKQNPSSITTCKKMGSKGILTTERQKCNNGNNWNNKNIQGEAGEQKGIQVTFGKDPAAAKTILPLGPQCQERAPPGYKSPHGLAAGGSTPVPAKRHPLAVVKGDPTSPVRGWTPQRRRACQASQAPAHNLPHLPLCHRVLSYPPPPAPPHLPTSTRYWYSRQIFLPLP